MSKQRPFPTTPWPNIDALIESVMLAALLRREGESLVTLLDRLDAAIGKAFDDEIYTDEINA